MTEYLLTWCFSLPNHSSNNASKHKLGGWEAFITELACKAPTLLHTLMTLVSFNDGRNTTKVGAAHYPGVSAAVAILLKERNREMCSIQSLVSVLMYSCHCEKQVCILLHCQHTIIMYYTCTFRYIIVSITSISASATLPPSS